MTDFDQEKNLNGSFGQCLGFLLFEHGARPDGSPDKPGRPWGQKEFADIIRMSDRTVRYWLDDKKSPGDLLSVERALFGASKNYDAWRMALRRAHRGSKREEDDETSTTSTQPIVQILYPEIRPVPGFTGRAELLDSLDRALWQQGGTAALTNTEARSAAIHGLGGVGKSVLAQEYGWRNRARYRGVWWLRAETEQTLIDDLIDLGSRLIPNLKEMQERDRALHLALDAIVGAGGDKPWLIVYDNAEKPGAVARLTPKTGAHILITSRWPRWQGHAQELPVDVFPEETATDFLLAERPHEARDAAGQLAEALGYLPLALSHARAYCAETNLSFDNYARRLSELIQEAPEDAEYPASVFATFNLAIAKAAEACPEAQRLMEIAAFLAPERIPLELITDDVMSEKQRENAVAVLFRVSLISHDTLDDGSRALSVHRLVQEVMRGRISHQGANVAELPLLLTLTAFDRGPVHDHTEWPRVARLLPHAIEILARAPNDGTAALNTAHLSTSVAAYLRSRGAYIDSEPLLQRTLNITEIVLGKDHAETAASLNNLAELYRVQGRYGKAEPLLQRAITIAETALGKDDPDRGPYLNNLAVLYASQGHYAKAEPLFRRAIGVAETAHGKDSPATAECLNSLVSLYRVQDRYGEAEPLCERTIAIAETALGKDHPDTGTYLSNLAGLHEGRGRYEEAEPLYQRAVAIAEKTLGPDHPDTGRHLNNLAELYRTQGRYADAASLFRRAITITEIALGTDHPDTGSCLNNLALLYHAQGNYAEAEPLSRQALAIVEAALGKNHERVGIFSDNLAAILVAQGRLEEAEPLQLRAVKIIESVLGPDHPDTGMGITNLAGLYMNLGRYAQAELLFVRALAIAEATLGPGHPATGLSLNNLAGLYHAQGQYQAAEPLYIRAVAIFEKSLGPDHPTTKTVRENYEIFKAQRPQ